MAKGKLEVLLVDAKGLKSGDFFSKPDPYCILTCGTQQQKSRVLRHGAAGIGTSWNERFIFTISEGTTELAIRVMDEDLLTADDELGEISIPLHTVFKLWQTPVTPYNVVSKSQKYRGEIRVALAFDPEASACHAS